MCLHLVYSSLSGFMAKVRSGEVSQFKGYLDRSLNEKWMLISFATKVHPDLSPPYLRACLTLTRLNDPEDILNFLLVCDKPFFQLREQHSPSRQSEMFSSTPMGPLRVLMRNLRISGTWQF